MSDYDDGAYCDFCRSTLGDYEHGGHEGWCPIVEIERWQALYQDATETLAACDERATRYRAALRKIAVVPDDAAAWDPVEIAREALGE